MGKKRRAGVPPVADAEQPGPSDAQQPTASPAEQQQHAAHSQPRIKRRKQQASAGAGPSAAADGSSSSGQEQAQPGSTAAPVGRDTPAAETHAATGDGADASDMIDADREDHGDGAADEDIEMESDSEGGIAPGDGYDADEGSDDSGSDDGNDSGDDGPITAAGQQQHASFLQGDKGASFAKAFAKIMAKPVKQPKTAATAATAATAGDADAAAAASAAEKVASVPILSASKRVVERDAAEAAEAEARKQAKLHRLQMKQRGHMRVPKKGEDPTADAREKALLRLATKGVVLLFNAVNKAQKQKQEALLSGKKPARMDKASFLADLKAGSRGVVAAATAAPGAAAAGSVLAAGQSQGQQPAGWEVLQQGFPGLTDGSKMKDWDKAADSDSEGDAPEQLQDSDGGEDNGW